jgi:hypothetical protein
VLALASTRLGYDFIHPLPTGIDSAHYANQVRSLLETGRLWKPDLPVTYALYLLIAAPLKGFGMHTSDAALLGSRLGDGIFPALMAIPTVNLARWSSRGEAKGFVLAISSVVILAASPGLLRMISDFQKNSIALTLLAFAVYFGYVAVASGRRSTAVACFAFVAATFLTHIGGAGATALWLGTALVAYLAFGDAEKGQKVRVFVSVSAVALLAVLGIAIVAPHKLDYATEGIPRVFSNPAGSSLGARPPGFPVSDLPIGMIDGPSSGFAPPEGFVPPEGFGPPGGFAPPDAFGPPMGNPSMPLPGGMPTGNDRALVWVTFGLSLAALAATAIRWRQTDAAGRITVLSTATLAMMLSCPLLNSEFFWRTVLMSIVPATLAYSAGFGMLATSLRWSAISALLGIVAVGLGTQTGNVMKPKIMDRGRLEELRTLKSPIKNPDRAVIVAQHGLEYWAQFATGVHAYQSDKVLKTGKYAHAYRLQLKLFPSNEDATVVAETANFRLIQL